MSPCCGKRIDAPLANKLGTFWCAFVTALQKFRVVFQVGTTTSTTLFMCALTAEHSALRKPPHSLHGSYCTYLFFSDEMLEYEVLNIKKAEKLNAWNDVWKRSRTHSFWGPEKRFPFYSPPGIRTLLRLKKKKRKRKEKRQKKRTTKACGCVGEIWIPCNVENLEIHTPHVKAFLLTIYNA